MFEDVFTVRQFANAEAFRIGALELTPQQLPHYQILTFGFRVTDGDRVLVYSGDTAPSDELVKLARGADLFVCEATLLDGELDGEPRGHLSADEAISAFEGSGAKRLLLTHRPEELPVPDGVEVVRDGYDAEV